MRRKIFILILLLSYKNIFGQLRPLPSPLNAPTTKQLKGDRINHNCIHKNKYTLTQRLQFYPFNKAVEVKLVAFDNKPDSNGLVYGNGTLPMKNNSVDYSQIDEIRTLNKIEIHNLTGIFYNVGYKGYIFTTSESGCYNPRNAILFIDSKGKTFAFIELCFQCQGHKTISSKVKTGEFCNQKYDLLKDFFKKAGIEIGITKGVGIEVH